MACGLGTAEDGTAPVIKQLRPFYSPEELSRVYSEPYDSTKWPDHILRVQYTAQRLKAMDPSSVADLSCGDGKIVQKSGVTCPVTLGDYNGDYFYKGPIEETIEQISPVDVFVLSETLEHVERPGELLSKIRSKADRLLLTTPYGEDNDVNPQHYWGWDLDGVADLLADVNWYGRCELWQAFPGAYNYYTFQVWECQ